MTICFDFHGIKLKVPLKLKSPPEGLLWYDQLSDLVEHLYNSLQGLCLSRMHSWKYSHLYEVLVKPLTCYVKLKKGLMYLKDLKCVHKPGTKSLSRSIRTSNKQKSNTCRNDHRERHEQGVMGAISK